MKTTSLDTQDFERLVDTWVQKAVVHGVTTFDELLSSLPGVYPSLVLESIRRLRMNSSASYECLSALLADGSWANENATDSVHRILLPVPHPLDYDWRFSDAAITRLLDACSELSDPGERVVLLGTPTLMRASIELGFPRNMILLDADRTIIDTFRKYAPQAQAEQCDLLTDPLPKVEGGNVVADPPWYVEHLSGFIWAAAQLCREGGYVLISLPPIGTRPGVEQDRIALFDWANQIGLTLVRLEPAVLPYVSPPFEINALRADGFSVVSTEWRIGDLALFSRDRLVNVPRPRFPLPIEAKWTEECLGAVRIRTRSQALSGFNDPTLVSVVSGDILPSVSRRDERRVSIDVWTSGNRVFACRGTSVLRDILRSLVTGEEPGMIVATNIGRDLTTAESLLVSGAARQVSRVVRLEEDEILSLMER